MSDHKPNLLNNIPVTNIWLLMAYAAEYSFLSEATKTNFIENSDRLPDLVGKLLHKAVFQRLRFGLSNGYVERARDVTRLRGKVNFIRTYARQLLKQGRIACVYEELSADTPRNRFVRLALINLIHVVKDASLKKELQSLVMRFDELGVSNGPVSLQDLDADRLSRHDVRDKEMIELAKMANSFNLPSEKDGAIPHLSADRNEHWVRKLFEKAIAGFYKNLLESSRFRVKTGSIFHWPVDEMTQGISDVLPNMKADIIIESADLRLIIDTKFNKIYTSGWMRDKTLRSGYLYQIYAYLRTQENQNDLLSLKAPGLLLHPSVGETIFEQVSLQGHLLSFATIDLTLSSEDIKTSLNQIFASSTRAHVDTPGSSSNSSAAA